MSHDVFISHSSRDKPVADAVCAALEGAGIRCWIAPRDLVAGRAFPGEIIRGIKSCRVMVLLFSAAANASPEVLREVQLATTHRLHLVNFRIEESGVSDDLAYFLGVPHWLDALTQPMREHHGRLIESVQALLAVNPPRSASDEPDGEAGAGGAEAIAEPARTAPRRVAVASGEGQRGRWTPAIVAAGILVLGAIGATVFWPRNPPANNVANNLPAATPAPTPAPLSTPKPTAPVAQAPTPPPPFRMENGGLVITGPVTFLDNSKPPAPEPEEAIEPAVEPPPQMKAADAKKPWENSLGMKFVRVPVAGGPTDGKMVWFSIYETRMQDYAAFWAENPTINMEWKLFESSGGPTHPVTDVSWKEARAFCKWLSERERKAGTLPAGLRYRLPSDHEWSCAVGLEEDASLPAMKKDKSNLVQFPWGKNWPPSPRAGNYPPIDGQKSDPFMTQAPVGSFEPNVLGIFDLGGNVREWCEDPDAPGSVYRIMRGAAFFTKKRDDQLSSARDKQTETTRPFDGGFRVVISGAVPKK